MTKLNDLQIRKFKVEAGTDQMLSDGNGLYLRARQGKAGKGPPSRDAQAPRVTHKSWMFRYMIDGRPRKFQLGSYPETGLADARELSAKYRAMVKRGVDPIKSLEEEAVALKAAADAEARLLAVQQKAQKESEEREKYENRSVRDLFDKWVADGVRRKDGNAELRRSFTKDVLPEIGSIAVRRLTEDDVRQLLRKVVGRGANRTADIAYLNLLQMFKWAEKRQPWRRLLEEGNPVELVDIRIVLDQGYDRQHKRERILSDKEIRELRDIFKAVAGRFDDKNNRETTRRPIARTTELAVWIMLSTICRVGELSMAEWRHVDLDRKIWIIPKGNRKETNGDQEDLTVYLSAFALEKFRRLHDVTGESKWCFPAKFETGHVCTKSISKQIGDRQTMFKKNAAGGARGRMKNRCSGINDLVLGNGEKGGWIPHDLRRTGSTIMQQLHVPAYIVERCMGHEETAHLMAGGTKSGRHYLHESYENKKREAWAMLGERLTTILNEVES